MHVTVIEDEPDIALLLQITLRDHTVDTLTADFRYMTDPVWWADHPTDAIICDQRLHGTTGIDILTAARASLPDARLVLYTAAPRTELAGVSDSVTVLTKTDASADDIRGAIGA